MLERLEISEFALIESADLELNPGFVCITGETGAGKSLLLGAISAITGKQVSKNLIRTGFDKAKVEAVFYDVKAKFSDDEEILSFIDEEDELILSREIKRTGRNTCRINGSLVSLSLLRKVGEALADIHGQNDRQQIFNKDKHLGMLDRFGHKEIDAKYLDYKKAYLALQEVNRQEKNLLADPEERRMVLERLDYQINEIEEVSPKTGEDELLREEKSLLQNKEKIKFALATALNLFEGSNDSPGLIENFDDISAHLSDIAPLNNEFEAYLADNEDLRESATSLKARLQDSLQRIDEEENNLEYVSARLDKISRLKRKYNGSIESVWEYYEAAINKREDLIASADNVEKIKLKKAQILSILQDRGLELRTARKKVAAEMELGIKRELQDLGMENAQFKVDFTEYDISDAKAYGLENLEFLLSANLGEDLKPLSKTASGGEASRIMLAIKVILAQADDIGLLVFDEIDTGISGEITGIVAEKLKQLSYTHQVICVTHQAQIAAAADQQFFIYKESDDQRTRTYIEVLKKEEREKEIARLLSGNIEDLNSLTLARQLLEAN